MKNNVGKQIRKIIILGGWLAAWQLLSIIVGNRILMVGPLETAVALGANIVEQSFWKTIFYSIGRIGAGFFVGVLSGLVLAMVSAGFSLIEEIVTPVLNLMKSIPVASFVVLFLIWWRSDMLSSVISFCVVLPVVYVNMLEGIRSTDGSLLEMADVFGMHSWNRLWYIYRPACKPFLDSSIRICVGMSWKSGVAAEVIGTPNFSIGEALYMSKIYLETADVLAWTAVTIILSTVCEKGILALWHAFCDWQPACRSIIAKLPNAETARQAVVLEGVSKRYAEEEILENVSATYLYGQTYFFRSASGSGKTTLFRLIMGLEKPEGGNIQVDSRQVAAVFQENRLCEDYSALKNVEMITGDGEKARQILLELLEQEALDKPCRELSGGMKRRVAIARAYASDRRIIILDEPFTGLDEENRKKVMEFMEKNSEGKSVLIATHTL